MKAPEIVSGHKADSLRMLPSGPDLVQIAYSTRSPALQILSRREDKREGEALGAALYCTSNVVIINIHIATMRL